MPFFSLLLLTLSSAAPIAPPIQLNDNLKTAGRLDGRVLTVRLVAEMGTWHPNGPKGRAIEIAAFGEEGAGPSAPGPLIRAVEGTTVAVTVRNPLASELRVFGLCARPGPCEPLTVAAGAARDVRFDLATPGTYYYWASTSAR